MAWRRLFAFTDLSKADGANILEVRAILKVYKAKNDVIAVFKEKGSFLYSGHRDVGKL